MPPADGEMQPEIESVAVIGAGPCGLAAAKYLVAERKFTKIEIFEQRDTVGGVWAYSPLNIVDNNFTIPRTEPSQDPDTAVKVEGKGAPEFVSPVYESLETNIPHVLMNYSDQKFPDESALFPPHAAVKEYLEAYAASLKPVLSLSTQVLNAAKVNDGTQSRWEIEVLDLVSGTRRKSFFDAIFVASGHYNDPFIPDIAGLADFSKAYPRSKVVVVGNSASGIDLSIQISSVAQRPVVVSEKAASNTTSDENTELKMAPEIVQFVPNGRTLHFSDGTEESNVDSVVFCTGYFYTYPFLRSLSPPVTSTGSHVQHLYEQILYIDDPTIAFIGVPQRIVPFPVAQAQSAWVARIWAGRLTFPPTSQMRAWESETYKDGNMGKSVHNLAFPKDVNYINKLHDWSLAAAKRDGLENDGAGKMPPYWDSKAAWTRERFPLIKAAYRGYGGRKQDLKTIEDLGFIYEGSGGGRL
ncbi:Flavin-binding monooxygenase-like [Geosmithia morbida]|uniref:Flavin-binding monooxygenase-like n=1 Tax=Geosmithia morbida TaxID=1094350 RepID=A0A9P4YQU1_9HYPO|nr:Flavin-binding monooxygenase-like [Geosmithia morbida]KAF4120882.1 Flavin-binding monooxygenase-like [Geosmithia morbida]